MYSGIIYKATNLSNGKVYIGQTTRSLENRIKCHLKTAGRINMRFSRAIVEEGAGVFNWEIIEHIYAPDAETIRAYLHIAENYHIMKHRSAEPEFGYNTIGSLGGNNKFRADVLRSKKLVPLEKCKGIGSTQQQARPFAVYSIYGGFLKYFPTIAPTGKLTRSKYTLKIDGEGPHTIPVGIKRLIMPLACGERPPLKVQTILENRG